MPVIRAADAVVHEMHGSLFSSYAAPARGSTELCAWRIEIPGGTSGVRHAVSREEVLLVLTGTLRVLLSDAADPRGVPADAQSGDVVLVPAGAELWIDNPGPERASAWVTTSVGLEARMADGSRLRPPWVR